MKKTWKELLGLKKDKDIVLLSPMEGESRSITEVNDPTFSERILGDGIAIIPKSGRVVAPINGRIAILFETKHAVSIVSEEGTEILIHIGLDTVNLRGEYFQSFVETNDLVKAGDLLLEFDLNKIKEAGYDLITPVVICNASTFSEICCFTGKEVKELDQIMVIKR